MRRAGRPSVTSTLQPDVLTEIAASFLSVTPPKEVPFMRMAVGFHSCCTSLGLHAAEGVNARGGFATRNDAVFSAHKWNRQQHIDQITSLRGVRRGGNPAYKDTGWRTLLWIPACAGMTRTPPPRRTME